MFRLIVLLMCLPYAPNLMAGWFGPSNAAECNEKYLNETNFPSGKQVIRRACFYGYGERTNEVKQVAKCVLSDADELYSKETAYKIIDKCAKKYKSRRGYNVLTAPLHADVDELEDRINELEDKLE